VQHSETRYAFQYVQKRHAAEVNMRQYPDDDLVHDRSIDNVSDDAETLDVVVVGVSDETLTEPDVEASHTPRAARRVVHLSSPSWEMLDDGFIGTPTGGTIPKGAHSIYDYLSVLEEVSPHLHAVEELGPVKE